MAVNGNWRQAVLYKMKFYKLERALSSYLSFIFSKADKILYNMAAFLTKNSTYQRFLNQFVITRLISAIILFFIN